MNEKEAIFARHSVRNYKPDKIEPGKVLMIKEKIQELNEDESVAFVDRGGPFSRVDLGIVKCHFEIGAGRKV